MILKEVADYIKGLYGRLPGPIDPEVKLKVIGAEEPITGRPADTLAPEWEKSRDAIKEYSNRDEDILAYALFPQVAEEFFKNKKLGITPPSVINRPPITENQKPIQITAGANPEEFIARVSDKKYQVKIAQLSSEGAMRTYQINLIPIHRDGAPRLPDGKQYEIALEGLHLPHPDVPRGELAKPSAPKEVIPETPAAPVGWLMGVPEEKGMTVKVPMPGKIISLKVKPGDRIKKGEMLLILEALKMQNEIDAPCDGTVTEVNVKPGDNVDNNTVVVRIATT